MMLTEGNVHVISVLLGKSMTAAEIARALKISHAAVSRHLLKLHKLKIACKDGRHYTIARIAAASHAAGCASQMEEEAGAVRALAKSLRR